jgi:hypothetical protein
MKVLKYKTKKKILMLKIFFRINPYYIIYIFNIWSTHKCNNITKILMDFSSCPRKIKQKKNFVPLIIVYQSFNYKVSGVN